MIEEELPTALVRASDVAIATDLGPTLNAPQHHGWSLLVLPFEYSACLGLSSDRGGLARLLPVNLQQTGCCFRAPGRLDQLPFRPF